MMSTYRKVLLFLLKVINGLLQNRIYQIHITISISLYVTIVIDQLYCIIFRQFIISPADQMKICEQRKALAELCSAIDFYSSCFTEHS